MGLANRLRRLDDAVLGPPGPGAGRPQPWWVRIGSGRGLVVLPFLVDGASRGSSAWVVATVAVGAAQLGFTAAAIRWWRRQGRSPWGRGRRVLRAALTVAVIGLTAAAIAAAVIAPDRSGAPRSSYATGCHRASSTVRAQVLHHLPSTLRADVVVVYGSRHAAVATALLSGPWQTPGGFTLPIDQLPADFVLTPRPIAPANQFARELDPPPPNGVIVVHMTGDEVQQDAVAAEACASSQLGGR